MPSDRVGPVAAARLEQGDEDPRLGLGRGLAHAAGEVREGAEVVVHQHLPGDADLPRPGLDLVGLARLGHRPGLDLAVLVQLLQQRRLAQHDLVHRAEVPRRGLAAEAADARGRGLVGVAQHAAHGVPEDDREVRGGVQRAGDEAGGRQRHGGLAAQGQQFLRHVHRRRIGIAAGGLGQLVARVDPRIERLAHLPGAQRGVVLALAHLDADLFGADRGRAAVRQRLEGGAAGGVGIGASRRSGRRSRTGPARRCGRWSGSRRWPRRGSAVVGAGGGVVVVVSVISVSMRIWAPGSAGVGTREISWGVQRTAVSTRAPFSVVSAHSSTE